MSNTSHTPTLAALDARAERLGLTRIWSRYTLKTVYRVGRANTQNTRRGTSGSHLHLLVCEVIVAVENRVPNTLQLGDYAGIDGCKNNGQYNGRVERFDTDAITCSKCLKRLAALANAIAEGK